MADTDGTEDVGALRAALESVKQEKAALEQERNSLRSERDDTRRRLGSESAARFDAEITAVDNAIAADTNELGTLQATLAGQMAEQKWTDASATQAKMSEVGARLHQAKQQKTYLAGQKEHAQRTPAAEQTQADPFEKFVSGWDTRVQPWIRKNPKFYSDQKYRSRVMAAANLAAGDGLVPGTSEYEKFVEDHAAQFEPKAATQEAPAEEQTVSEEVEIETPREIPQNAAPEKPQGRAAGQGSMASLAARPTRSNPGTAPRQQAKLTPDQAEAAITLAHSLKPELNNKADIYKWYYDMLHSPAAQRKRAEWAAA